MSRLVDARVARELFEVSAEAGHESAERPIARSESCDGILTLLPKSDEGARRTWKEVWIEDDRGIDNCATLCLE